jgi:hypothetical protein
MLPCEFLPFSVTILANAAEVSTLFSTFSCNKTEVIPSTLLYSPIILVKKRKMVPTDVPWAEERKSFATNLEDCFSAKGDNSDKVDFLHTVLSPIISVFLRLNLLQNLGGCPHFEHLIPIVVAHYFFCHLETGVAFKMTATNQHIHVIT